MIYVNLPMYIDKRLTLKVESRMCAEIVIQKSSIKNEVTRQVCLQLFEIIYTGVCQNSLSN